MDNHHSMGSQRTANGIAPDGKKSGLNPRFGRDEAHSMGDAALKIVAAALKKVLSRADDFVARYGGEEFIVILPNTDERGTQLMAERMLNSVRGCNIPYECAGPLPYVTVSIGATSGKVTPGRCRDDFIRLADDALYQAKDNGRNNSVF